MICRNCGAEINEGSIFCQRCGTGIMENAVPNVQPEAVEVKKGKNVAGKVIGIAAGGLLVAAAAAFGVLGFFNNSLKKEKDALGVSVSEYKIEKYNDKLESISGEWEECSFFDITSKKELLEEIESLLEDASEDAALLEKWNEELTELKEQKAGYDLAESFSDYEDALKECVNALEQKDVDQVEDAFEEAEEVLETVIEENNRIVEEKMEYFSNVDLTYAEKQEIEEYNNGIAALEKMIAQEEYQGAEELFGTMDELIYPYIKPEKALNLHVQQVDVSDFPNVKLYVQIEDAGTKEVPTNLEQALFYIGKKDANGNYIRQKVSKVNQLNQVEALSVNMVADVSGSMDGSYMEDAKKVMKNFVKSVQFNAGDKVELIAFSTGVYLEREFCSDANLLTRDIDNLQIDNMTSLYDALYSAVTRTASQTGARCVMAFTDGYDNYSSCDMYDVVEVAKRYKVPIFIIGIGSVDSDAISYIASETGGAYHNINEIDSMEDIYKNIYKQQKEMFMVEFVDSSEMNISNNSDIIIRYNSPEYGGESYESYTPNILLNVNSDTFFKEGPEAVVEAYMKAFDDAMTNSDFSYIEEYLLYDSPIYKAQSKYVLRNIAEALDSCEIVEVSYLNNDECIVKTRETYFVQRPNEPLSLLTQECKYVVVYVNGKWQMQAFAESVNVLSQIKQ